MSHKFETLLKKIIQDAEELYTYVYEMEKMEIADVDYILAESIELSETVFRNLNALEDIYMEVAE